MGVPAHDERDFVFANKYNLPVKQVITSKKADEKVELPFIEEGVMINSGEFNGLSSKDALVKIAEYVEEKRLWKKNI